MLLAPAAAGTTIYVDDDAPPGGDGATWSTAYRFLQDALAQPDISEIRVAQGRYLADHSEADPDGTGDVGMSFHLEGEVALRGGYAGLGAPDPDARDIKLYETILDGDLAGDDGPDFANNNDNTRNVLKALIPATGLIEGFIVRGGRGTSGGGMYLLDAELVISECTFRSNWAWLRGGAVYVENGSMWFDGCLFTSNYGDIGGCMQIRGTSVVTVTDSVFEDNEAFAGGGIYKIEGDLTIVGCEFTGNVVADSGGGVMNGYGPATVANSIFSRNQAGFHSGGMMLYGPGSMVNCVFSENSSSIGGGSYCSGQVLIDNCTYSLNSPGAVVVDQYGAPVFTNSILWGNTPYQIGHDPSFGWTPPAVSFSDIQDGWTGPGSDNIDADPLFVQAGTGNVRLSGGSPCLDAGNAAALPPDTHDLDGDGDTDEPLPVDLDGNPRVSDGGLDMGAYEGVFALLPAADEATGIDPGEAVILIPNGGPFNPVVNAAVIVLNISGPEDATFAVTQHATEVHPAAQGYSELSFVLSCETSMEPGQFRASVFIPFSLADLQGADPTHVNLTAYDAAVGNWALAVADNTAASPGFGGPIGDHIVSLGPGWGTTQELGDYGVFYNNPGQVGFAWANLDRAGELALGLALCPADCRQTPDGEVGVPDFLALLASWGAASGGGPCDVDFDGTVGETDFLAMLTAWGSCPEPAAQALPVPQALPALPVMADLDGDALVGRGDVQMLRERWGEAAHGCAADLDGDGVVGARDMLLLYAGWGHSER
jgi:hypothetical protein